MNPHQPVSFPLWKGALAQSDLSPVVQAVYTREILTLLRHCKKCHSPVSVAFIKQWLAGPRLAVRESGLATGADQAREALRWFYRNAPKGVQAKTEIMGERPIATGKMAVASNSPTAPSGLAAPPASSTYRLPTENSKEPTPFLLKSFCRPAGD